MADKGQMAQMSNLVVAWPLLWSGCRFFPKPMLNLNPQSHPNGFGGEAFAGSSGLDEVIRVSSHDRTGGFFRREIQVSMPALSPTMMPPSKKVLGRC